MNPCPSINTPRYVRRDAATRVAYRHQMAALVLCLCIANDLFKLVQCRAVRPHGVRGRQVNAAINVTMETTQKYVTGGLVDGATEQSPTSDPDVLQHVKNSPWRTVHATRKTAVEVLCRIINYKLNNAQQGRAFTSRLLHKCVEWKYKSASQEVGNKLLQGRTFHPDTGAGHLINKDPSIGVRWRTYSGSPGRKQYKLNYRQTRNVTFAWKTRSRSRSKRAANMEEPAAMATDTYDARGITLTPRTFYTFYNKSAAKFTRDEQLVPVKITTPTNSPPSPPMLRTSGLSDWKTVSLQKAKTHSNSTPSSATVDRRSFVTSIQSPASVVTTTDVEQTTTPLLVVENKTSAVTQQENWTSHHVTTETSMVTSTASPPDDSTHNSVSTTTQTITEAKLIDTLNPQNSTNTFRTQNTTTETVTDEQLFHASTTPMLPNITAHSESLRKDYTTRAAATTMTTTFDNYVLTTNHTHDITYDDNNISSSLPSPAMTSAIATTKQTPTTTTTSTTTTTHEATTETTKTNRATTTAAVTEHVITSEATTAQQHIRSTIITSTTTQFPSATTRSAKNVTNASRGQLSSTTIAGITTGSLAIFWLFLGPLVCLICHLKDREKNRRNRQKEDELGHRLVNELIRSELAKGRGKLYKTEVRDDRELEPLPPGTNGTAPVGPVCVTVV